MAMNLQIVTLQKSYVYVIKSMTLHITIWHIKYMSYSNQNNIKTLNEDPLPPFLILFVYLEILQYYIPFSKSREIQQYKDY